jgi:hypothetical protein
MATVTVSFGSETKQNHAITAGWIHGAMEAQRRAGQPICATVRVEGGGIDLSLPVSGHAHALQAARGRSRARRATLSSSTGDTISTRLTSRQVNSRRS